MTTPPLPESPCVRCRLIYTNTDGSLAGSRFYLSYAGSAPTAGNCITLADTITGEWGDHLGVLVHEAYTLTGVDVLDIATDSGASAEIIVSEPGLATGTQIAAQVATNIEYDIARRYRGGKPRMFLPPPDQSAVLNDSHYTTDFVDGANTAFAAFMAAVVATPPGAMGALAHVNLSYYQGFHNVTNSSGRTRAAPLYRAAALVDTIEGYATKQVMGSQRRRRTAVTA